MKRHKNLWLGTFDDVNLDHQITAEMKRGRVKFGKYKSMHEAYAVIKEELEEFWDGIKRNDPDPHELLQIAATARCALVELCEQARRETVVIHDDLMQRQQIRYKS